MTQNGAQFQQVAYAPPAQPIIVQMQFGPNPVSHILIIWECKPNERTSVAISQSYTLEFKSR